MITLSNISVLYAKQHQTKCEPSQSTPLPQPMEPGIVTFRNLGNTCFMNSILQLVRHSTYISQLLAEQKMPLCSMLCSFSGQQSNPHEVLEAVQRRYPQFSGKFQQDAHEFFLCLVELLQEELRGHAKAAGYCEETNETDDLSRALQTQYQVVEFCQQCGRQNSRQVRDENLLLQFDRKTPRIDQMIASYFQTADPRQCPECGAETIISQQIERFPDQLILVLNRFATQSRKLEYAVRIPETLSLRDFSGSEYSYQLNCVVNHQGGLSGGHYTASVFSNGACFEVSDCAARRVLYQACDNRAYIVSYALITESEPFSSEVVKQAQLISSDDGVFRPKAQEFCFGGPEGVGGVLSIYDGRKGVLGVFSGHKGISDVSGGRRGGSDGLDIPRSRRGTADISDTSDAQNVFLPLATQKGTIYQAASHRQTQLVIAERLTAFPELSFLGGLKRLCLRGLRTGEIDAARLPRDLVYLSAQDCGLTDFPPLQSLFGLEIVDLSRNRIFRIQESCVPKQIISLNLGYNRIKRIPNLTCCLCLRALDLGGNRRLQPNFQFMLPASLEALGLRGCRLRYLGDISCLPGLRSVDIAGNFLGEGEGRRTGVLVRDQ